MKQIRIDDMKINHSIVYLDLIVPMLKSNIPVNLFKATQDNIT